MHVLAHLLALVFLVHHARLASTTMHVAGLRQGAASLAQPVPLAFTAAGVLAHPLAPVWRV